MVLQKSDKKGRNCLSNNADLLTLLSPQYVIFSVDKFATNFEDYKARFVVILSLSFVRT